MKLLALLTGALLIAGPAAAQEAAPAPTLSISPGETVTARMTPDGRFVELSRARGEASGERAADTVRFSFSDMSGMRMLNVENGYQRALLYRARMFIGGRSANTSICPVMGGIVGIESWGDPIDRLELREPRLLEGDVPFNCQ